MPKRKAENTPKAEKQKEEKNNKEKRKKEDNTGKKQEAAEKVPENQYKFENFNTKDKDGNDFNQKILLWNVAGIRAWIKKNGLDHIRKEDPDIVCLQETKCSAKDIPDEVKQFQRSTTLGLTAEKAEGYYMYWCEAKQKGYSGVSLWSKEKPINVTYGIGNETFDDEGRAITAEYENYYLVTTYVPNSGRKLVRLEERQKWDALLREHVTKLDNSKPVILCGDMNVAHTEIDLANPKTNKRNAGFTQEERDGFTELLNLGYKDTFRELNPNVRGAYSFWTYMGNAREKNVGWRLDYFVCSERIIPKLCDCAIQQSVKGSDHCPLVLLMAL